MGVFDVITWHADLPDLPEGFMPWHFSFQTKDIPGHRQRQFEVTHEGQLQQRVSPHLGAPVPDDVHVIHQRMQNLVSAQKVTYETGALLGGEEFIRTTSDLTGEIVFYDYYGEEKTGRLEYKARFANGLLCSVSQTTHRVPDTGLAQKWRDARKSSGSAKFEVRPLPPSADSMGENENG